MKLVSSIIALSLALLSGTAASSNQQPQAPVELDEAVKLMAAAKTSFNNYEYKEAINSAKRALEIRERLLPADSTLIDDSLSYLGQLHLFNEQSGEARKFLQRLLARREQKVGMDHVSLTSILDDLTAANFRQGDFDNAQALSLRSLKIKEKSFGPESIQVAGQHYSLGEMYRGRGKFKDALNSYTQALVSMGKLESAKPDQIEKVKTGYQCVAYQTKDLQKLKVLTSLLEAITRPSVEKKFAEVLNGKALSLPAPRYPLEAIERGLEGSVAVRVIIDEEGNVINASDMCQGPAYFTQAAIQSALRARFSPTKVNGVPIKVDGVIVYNFQRR